MKTVYFPKCICFLALAGTWALSVGCGAEPSKKCALKTCLDLGVQCGVHDDGCGGRLDCGGCEYGTCDSNGRCACQPKTCQELSKQCGLWDDGCGQKIRCAQGGGSHYLGYGGEVIEATVSAAASWDQLVVVWKEFGDGQLLVQSAAAGQAPAGEASVLAGSAQDEFPRWYMPTVEAVSGGFVAFWNAGTGSDPFDMGVWIRPMAQNGLPGTQGASQLRSAREILVKNASPVGDSQQAWIWTATVSGNELTPQDQFLLTPLHDVDANPVVWSIGEPMLTQVENPRMVVLPDGFAVLYELDNREGLYFERLGRVPASIRGDGQRIGTANKLDGRLRRYGDRLLVGMEDVLEKDGEIDQLRAGFVLFDAQGNLVAEPVARQIPGPSPANMRGLYFIDALFVEGQIRLYWTERFLNEDNPDAVELELFEARYSSEDGSMLSGPTKLLRFDKHRDRYQYPDYLDPGFTAAVMPVGDHLAIIHGIGFYHPESGGGFAFTGTDYYLVWSCL